MRTVSLENSHLSVLIAPEVGGRVVSLIDKSSGHEFLWRNERLELKHLAPGSEYDPNFFGGIDELIPNDHPERFDDIDLPDHGELWTTELKMTEAAGELNLSCILPAMGLRYERRMSLEPDRPELNCHYRITNESTQMRRFLWKLHAAIAISPGDEIICPAATARVADLQWSRRKSDNPFAWPVIAGDRADIIPPADGTMDFFYLYDLSEGRMTWRRLSAGIEFTYRFDPAVFPYAWYFASFGGFDGHYVGILEPCTAMPISLIEAAKQGTCTTLNPGEALETDVQIYAGPIQD